MARKKLDEVQPIEITLAHNVLVTSSHQVAKHFGKSHDNVLRDIRNIIEKAPKDWADINFEDTEESVVVPASGGIRKDPAFLMTRDGFSILAMGFTGEKAFQWKLRYIEAFNRMEAEIHSKYLNAERILEALPKPERESKEIHSQRRIKLIRGYLSEWAALDKIPLDVAESVLCTFLQIDRLEHCSADQFSTALDFIWKITGKTSQSGEPASEEHIRQINTLIVACAQFQYTREYDATTYLKDRYALDLSDSQLSQKDADKIITLLIALMHELYSHTTLQNQINKLFYGLEKPKNVN